MQENVAVSGCPYLLRTIQYIFKYQEKSTPIPLPSGDLRSQGKLYAVFLVGQLKFGHSFRAASDCLPE